MTLDTSYGTMQQDPAAVVGCPPEGLHPLLHHLGNIGWRVGNERCATEARAHGVDDDARFFYRDQLAGEVAHGEELDEF
jgi:hypothetical protein